MAGGRPCATCEAGRVIDENLDRRRQFTASSLLFGTAMHAALAKLQDLRLAGAEAVELEELLPAYDEAWTREQPAPVRFDNGETADALRQLAERMLTHVLGAQAIQPPGRTVAIEHTERRELPGQPFDLLGRFDLLSVHEDALIITDFKTSRARWSTVGPDDLQQLLLYAWILAPLARALELKQIRMRWVVLTKTRTPAIQIVEQEPGHQAVQRLLRVVERIAAAIAGCHWYPFPTAEPMSPRQYTAYKISSATLPPPSSLTCPAQTRTGGGYPQSVDGERNA